MSVGMFWYTSSAWQETQDLYVNDGQRGDPWKRVIECYIYDGSAWKLCFIAEASLDSFTVLDDSSGCDPTLGNVLISWTYSVPAGTEGDWYINIDFSFDNGSSWTQWKSNLGLDDGPIGDSLDGQVGFSSLDNTWFRLRMVRVADGIPATNSPRFAYPPFAC